MHETNINLNIIIIIKIMIKKYKLKKVENCLKKKITIIFYI